MDTPDLSAEAEVGEVDGVLYEGLAQEQPPAETEGEAPQLVTVKIDGVESQVSLEEAIAGYQRQADYTAKTQGLATQRAELEQAERLYKALEADPARTLAALSAAYGADGTMAEDDLGLDDPPDPIQQQLAQVEEFMAQQQQRELELQIEGAITKLHGQFGEFDDDKLIEFAIDNGIPNLDVAYAAMAFASPELQAARAKRESEAAALAAKGNLPPVSGGHGVQGGSVVDGADAGPPQSVEASWNAAARALGMEEFIVPE